MNRSIIFQIPNTHSQIILEVSNIFDQEGLKVIHCHNTFDTDDTMVLESSVMGQFIKYCNDKQFDLDKEISKWIERNKHKSIVEESLPCRKDIFNIGILCPINVNGEMFALATFDDLQLFLDTGAMELDAYISFLDHLWMSLGKFGTEKSIVNIPAFGNRIVNVANNGFTIDQKIGLIVQSYFKRMKKHRLFETLRICIHESEAKNLDLKKWGTTILPYLHQFSQLPLGLKTLNSRQKGLFAGIDKPICPSNSSISRNSEDKPKTVFISHAEEDSQEAEIVYDYLESRGYKCWIDKRDITPGIPYAKEIMKGFKNSDVVVVVISKNAMHSVGVKNEIDNVYKNNKTIIPFRIDDTALCDELSFYLSSTQWINAFPKFEEHLENIDKALNQLLK